MQLTVTEFNKRFGEIRAEKSDIGKFFITDGTAWIPKAFWNFIGFDTFEAAKKENIKLNNPDGIIYEIMGD